MARLYRPDGSALVVHAHLLGPAEIRQLAAELDIRPTKTLGQNFVHDPNTVRRIVAAADITAADHVMEIGPGLGSLTLAIAEVAGSLTVVEIDPTLAARLPQTLAERAPEVDVEIILKDALQLSAEDYAAVRDTAPTALVANLPYNVSVPVLLHILELFPSIERVLVMVQLEVAERLAAVPGSKIYGSPSVKASFYGAVKKAGIVGPNVFWPVPKVDSGLVRIDRYTPQTAAWSLDNSTRLQVFTVVDAAFAQRRKTLRAALKNLCGSGEAAAQACAAAGIDPTRRGETLTTAEFVALAGAVNSQQSD